jgi:hypothetical protein
LSYTILAREYANFYHQRCPEHSRTQLNV